MRFLRTKTSKKKSPNRANIGCTTDTTASLNAIFDNSIFVDICSNFWLSGTPSLSLSLPLSLPLSFNLSLYARREGKREREGERERDKVRISVS